MKVVIDIPDYDLQSVENGSIACGIILKAVKNGIILPEGHGDLIDRDELELQLPTPIEDEYKTVHRIVDSAPTVIEADKESEE